jgi:hypothetical protein
MLNPKTYAKNPKDWRLFKAWLSIENSMYEQSPRPPVLGSYREIGRLASKFYYKLNESDFIKLPGIHKNINLGPEVAQIDSSELNYSPKIGSTLPYIFISGHYYSTRKIEDPYSTKPVLSNGVLYNINNNSNPMVRAPNADLIEDALELKNIINSAMSDVIDDYLSFVFDKFDYLGVVFGRRGLHFPK